MDQIQVPRSARDQRLEVFLSQTMPGMNPQRLRALAGAGRIRINGKAVRLERRLWGGEVIEVDRPPPTAAPRMDGPAIPVIHSDEDMVVVDKPSDVVVEREGTTPSVVGLLASKLQGFDVEGRAEPGVVHRLDRETTGCLALARNDRAVEFLKEAFDQKRITKRYWALVQGHPPEEHRIETSYGRDPSDPRRYTTRVSSPRRAALSFLVVERFPDAAWLEVSLETGRTHQIRVQLSESGWPVIGDRLYGSPSAIIGRQALHAHLLTLPKRSGEYIIAEAPMPDDMQQLLSSLRRHS